MGKKKKFQNIQINNENFNQVSYLTADSFALPETFSNVPKNIKQANDKAFDYIRPKLERMINDSVCHTGKNLGILARTDATFIGYSVLANLTQNGLIRAGVEMRADEMTRKWGELTRKGKKEEITDQQQEVLTKITEEMEKFKVKELFRTASCMNGYMGGCLLFVDTGEEEKRLTDPLILDKATFKKGSLQGFRIIEPYLVAPGMYNSVNPMRGDYFKPTIWYVQGIPVHRSRLIHFTENNLTSILKPAYNFFGLSLAQKVLDAVSHYTDSRESANRLMQKYALTVLKTNMQDVLANGFDTNLQNRIKYFVQNRSNDGCAAIDKEMEDLVTQTTSLAGVTDVVRQNMEYVAAMFNEPVTKMWGLSPNGFSNGDNELKNHYDNIRSQQEKMFGEPIKRVIDIIQQNMYEEVDQSIIFKFAPLSEEDERAMADTNKVQVDTDVALITAGVISPEEARERLIADENSGYNNLNEEPPERPEEVTPFKEDVPKKKKEVEVL